MRRIDSKYSIEGEQILKTATGEPIPEDEPTFQDTLGEWG